MGLAIKLVGCFFETLTIFSLFGLPVITELKQ